MGIDPTRPPHPGHVLRTAFLRARGTSQRALAEHLEMHSSNLSDLLHGRARITPALAWKLAGAFGTTPEFWAKLQCDWDLWDARPQTETPPLLSTEGPLVQVPTRKCTASAGPSQNARRDEVQGA
ncbi:MAG: HigA family addiction module antitoxin [Planctomycetota bacterium]